MANRTQLTASDHNNQAGLELLQEFYSHIGLTEGRKEMLRKVASCPVNLQKIVGNIGELPDYLVDGSGNCVNSDKDSLLRAVFSGEKMDTLLGWFGGHGRSFASYRDEIDLGLRARRRHKGTDHIPRSTQSGYIVKKIVPIYQRI